MVGKGYFEMKIGIRAHDFGKSTPEKLAEKLQNAGVEAVQLAIPKAIEGIESYADVTDTVLNRIKNSFEAAGVEISILGCYIEPSLANKAERLAQVEIFKKGIYCAEALKAGCIGTETTLFSGEEGQREKAFGFLQASLDEIFPVCQQHKVLLAIEPVAVHTVNNPAMVRRLIAEYKSAPLGFILDPLNLLVPATVERQHEIMEEAINVFGERIAAMHIKDATILEDWFLPCPLGEGVMQYGPVIVPWLKATKKDIPLLREEIKPEFAKQNLNWMRNTFT